MPTFQVRPGLSTITKALDSFDISEGCSSIEAALVEVETMTHLVGGYLDRL